MNIQDLKMPQGDSGTWIGTCTDDSGNLVDVSGYVGTFTLQTPTPTTKVVSNTGFGLIQVGPLSRTDTNGARSGTYNFDIVFTLSGQRVTGVKGKFLLEYHANP